MIGDPSLGDFLMQILPFVTHTLSPDSSAAIGKFMEEIAVVLAAHVTEHAGSKQLGTIRQRLLSYAEREIKPPQNHGLQKAFYVSFLRATEVIYLARLEQLGLKPATVSWVTGLKNHSLGKLRPSSITGLSLGPKAEKEALIERLKDLRSEIVACSDISPADLEMRLPLRPDVAVLNQLTLEAKNRGLGASGGQLAKVLIDEGRWYTGLGEPLKAIAIGALQDSMSAFFAEEIKTNQRVAAILSAEVLAGTNFTLDRLIGELCDAKVWLVAVNKELDSLKEEVSNEFQKVFRVIDSEFIEHQKHEPVKPFLGISTGDWALVAQERSMERDLAAEVTERVLQPNERTVLQIIRGEPGSGKTTLLLQVGAKLVASGCVVLEVLPAAPLDEFQYFAKKLTRKAQARLFILVDDIYRDEDRAILVEVLSNLGETLPLTIIATTPSFADRTGSIRENSFLDRLPAVSPDRLTDRELAKLKQLPAVAKLSPKRFKQLTESRQILVVMLQLTEGRPIDEILSATAGRLKKKFSDTYRAWGVVVAFSQHNLPVPSSLLNLLLGKPYFSDSLRENARKVGSEGIIFPSSFLFKDSWFAGHVLIARFAFKVEFSDTLRSICDAAVQAASLSDGEHALFLGRMFGFLSAGGPTELELANQLLASHEKRLCTLALLSPEAMADWGTAFLRLARKDLALQCLSAARPGTPSRALYVARTLEELGEFSKAILAGKDWCDSHPQDTLVRTFVLGLAERKGGPEQVKQAITQTAVWLAEHDQDSYVRTFYLGLVERKGGPEQVEQAITQTAVWLAEHDQNTDVRTFYLGLVERSRDPELVKQAISQTAKWLAAPAHADDTSVRTFYLGLVERTMEQAELAGAVERTYNWLRQHPGATNVWSALIALLTRSHQSLLAAEVAASAISANPRDLNLVEHYLDLCTVEQTEADAEKLLADLHTRFPKSPSVAVRRATWLGEKGRITEGEAIYGSWLAKHPSFQMHHSYGRFLLELDRWSEARIQFDKALKIHRGFQIAHEGMGLSFSGLAAKSAEAGHARDAERHLRQAERYFKSAIHWAGVHDAPVARFYTSLGWFYLDQKRYVEALSSFESAIREDPEHFSNYWGKGLALKCFGRYSEALDGLNTALSKAPQPLQPPASDEIPKLIEECRDALRAATR
jgi:tetratricopeptide (TPR) repeat protein